MRDKIIRAFPQRDAGRTSQRAAKPIATEYEKAQEAFRKKLRTIEG